MNYAPSIRFRICHRSIASALAALVLAYAAPSRAEVLTLRSLEQRALSARQNVRGRAARVGAAEGRIDAARAEGRPTVSFGADGTIGSGGQIVKICNGAVDASGACPDGQSYVVRGSRTIDQSGAFVPSIRFNARFLLEGTLYDFGRTHARVVGGRAEVAAAEAEVAATREDVVRSVRAAYLSWYGAFEIRRFAEATRADAEERVTRMRSGVGEGARAQFEVESAELEAARLELELSRADADEDDARHLLGQAVGEAIPDTAEPDPSVVALEPPPDATPNPRMAQALELRRDVSAAATQIYKLRYAPVLIGSAQAGVTSQVGVRDQQSAVLPMYQLMVGLTIPLWDPKSGDYLVREARAQAAELAASAHELRAAAAVTNLRARTRFDHATRQVTLANDVLRMSERSAASSEERWRIAGGPFEAVLSARERVRRAHQDVVRAQLDRADAALRLVPVD